MFKEEPNKFVIIIVAILIALLVWRSTGKTVISSTAEQDTITVSSTANVEAAPDKAELYVRIETLNKDAGDSQQENSKVSAKVISELALAGVAKKDIETRQYYLSQKIRYGPEGEQIVEGYQTIHVLKVTTTKTKDVGSLIDAAIKGGANGIENIVFTLSDDKKAELTKQALGQAAGDVEEKAQKIAESLGVKLGKAHTVSESSFGITPYYATYAAAEKAAPTPTQVLPQNVEVSATLSVEYKIS